MFKSPLTLLPLRCRFFFGIYRVGAGFAVHALRCAGMVVMALSLASCLGEQPKKSGPIYLSLKQPEEEERLPRGEERLPLAPHILTIHARPAPDMAARSAGAPMLFMVLDKRTLKIHRLVAAVGERRVAPWGGGVLPLAYASDLVIRDGQAWRGPEGHFNPAVWVMVTDDKQQTLYEGWLFMRDSAQTAWDHPRFDLTFLGPVEPPKKEVPVTLTKPPTKYVPEEATEAPPEAPPDDQSETPSGTPE